MAGAGTGLSMYPLFGRNTFILTAPIAFDDLEKGMIVAYRSRRGYNVMHRLEIKRNDSWVAAGINNPGYDPERVTRGNLLGSVYGCFNSAPLE